MVNFGNFEVNTRNKSSSSGGGDGDDGDGGSNDAFWMGQKMTNMNND